MEWLEQLQGQIVGLDSTPLIYFIEQNPTYLEMMRLFFRALNQVLLFYQSYLLLPDTNK
jgi:hypothetical protein